MPTDCDITFVFLSISGSRVYRPYTDGGRAKRDLDIDPKDWLALLTLVEAERKQKAHEQSRRVTNLFQFATMCIWVWLKCF